MTPSSDKMNPVREALRQGVREQVYPGAALWVWSKGQVFHEAVGQTALTADGVPVETDTLFDIASLTKPMSTVTMLMLLVAEGRLDPDDKVADFLPGQWSDSLPITLFHLLTHSSGLPDWRPFYKKVRLLEQENPGFMGGAHGTDWIVEQVAQVPRGSQPGTQSVYSDLGFILLGALLEKVSGMPLDALFDKLVKGPLALSDTRFNRGNREDAFAARTVAATAFCPWRERVLCGQVHDDNTFSMGGVAGHAGLFSTADDVGRWAVSLMDAWHGRSERIPQALARRFMSKNTDVPGSSWGYGFDTPTAPSSAGSHFGPHSVGHLGFTGTSVWMEMDREWVVVLLTNRVHPDPENVRIRQFRPRLHDLVAQALTQSDPVPGG